MPQRIESGWDAADRLPWFVYAIPIVLVAFIVIFVIVGSWVPAT